MASENREVYRDYVGAADSLSGMPPQAGWAKWFGGVVFPLFPLWGAISCWVEQAGYIPGSRGTKFEVTGTQAVVLGFFLLGLALFAHFHFFWGNSRRLSKYMEAGKIVSGILIVGCMLYLFWFMFYRCFYY